MWDLFNLREGMVDLELPVLNIGECKYDANLIFPYYDVTKKEYTNQNNFMYHNFQNILKYASKPCRTN
jgi:hypothetical protein